MPRVLQPRRARALAAGVLPLAGVMMAALWLAAPAGAGARGVHGAARRAQALRVTGPVKTDAGLVAGVTDADGVIRIFKGIPYAAPPVGSLRWRPPQPADPWTGVRQATRFGPVCPQIERSLPSMGRLGPMSEDCLTLNVWAPARPPAGGAPVIVWIHGGAFTEGAGSLPVYDGSALARRGAVVVTLNYRLGALGFLAHPLLSKESSRGVSGNYGLLDQLAALRWVQANIRAFGGRPDRVAVAGESAGAVSIGCLLVSPQARGLFHAAILESGTPYGVTRYLHDAPAGQESMDQVGELVARRLGCDRADDVVAALRSKSVDEILNAAHPASPFFGDGVRFSPVIDRWLIPDRPATLLAARQQLKVPVIVGANLDEGTLFVAGLRDFDVDAYRRFIRTTFRDRADEVLARFPVTRDADVKPALARVVGYSAFVAPARRLARDTSALGARTYLYFFTRVRPSPWAARLGAFHGSEIPFVFGTLTRMFRDAPPVGDTDRALSEAMMGYWTRFAASDNPNAQGAVPWPRYRARGDEWLELGDEIQARPGVARALCDFFDRVAAERQPGAPGRSR